MKLKFTYNKKEDIWCLLNKGRSSNNSPFPTEAYKKLVAVAGENPTEASASLFIDQYLKEENYSVAESVKKYQEDFQKIVPEFERIAEKVFGVTLDQDLTAYLTVNNRCPYSIPENLFFVPISHISPIRVIMHELWHFYTWNKFGQSEMEKVGPQKYNDMKEALTVLLNVECSHLLREGEQDKGYPQHQKMREVVLELWKEKSDIEYVWTQLALS